MSESRAFCPRCGDPVDRGATDASEAGPAPSGRAPLCGECYFEEFELVDAPERIEVPVCSGCGAIKRGKRWVDVGARDYTDVAIDEMADSLQVHVAAEDIAWRVDPEQVDRNTIRMNTLVSGAVRGRLLESEFVVPVKISRGTCDRCGRIAGEYYAATVQVRARDRTPDAEEIEGAIDIAQSYVADREEAGDRNAFLTEIDEIQAGVDVRVSTTRIGRAIADRVARRFGGNVDESQRLVTEDEDGNEVYRMAYAVCLPPFRSGDVIVPEDIEEPVLVGSVRGNLKGTGLRSGEPYEAPFEDGDAPDARVVGSIDDATETTLVAVADERAIQVLDPETYETRTIRRPDGVGPNTGTVSVVKTRVGLYPLPTDADDGRE